MTSVDLNIGTSNQRCERGKFPSAMGSQIPHEQNLTKSEISTVDNLLAHKILL